MPPEPVTETGFALNEGWRHDEQPIVQVTWAGQRSLLRVGRRSTADRSRMGYAARAGTATRRYAMLEEIAWFSDNSGQSPLDTARLMAQRMKARALHENRNGLHEIAGRHPNAFGLYDTLGNAWEWVADWHDEEVLRPVSLGGSHWPVVRANPSAARWRLEQPVIPRTRLGSDRSPIRCREHRFWIPVCLEAAVEEVVLNPVRKGRLKRWVNQRPNSVCSRRRPVRS